jgi:hypothetical protein
LQAETGWQFNIREDGIANPCSNRQISVEKERMTNHCSARQDWFSVPVKTGRQSFQENPHDDKYSSVREERMAIMNVKIGD